MSREEDPHKIFSVKKMPQFPKYIENEALWTIFSFESLKKGLLNSEKMLYTKNVLSSHNLYIEKKNKKGLIVKIDVSDSVRDIELRENILYMTLKSGQGSEIKSVRPDDVINLIFPNEKFKITRERYLDINLKEI